jgi:hypothetical protein
LKCRTKLTEIQNGLKVQVSGYIHEITKMKNEIEALKFSLSKTKLETKFYPSTNQLGYAELPQLDQLGFKYPLHNDMIVPDLQSETKQSFSKPDTLLNMDFQNDLFVNLPHVSLSPSYNLNQKYNGKHLDPETFKYQNDKYINSMIAAQRHYENENILIKSNNNGIRMYRNKNGHIVVQDVIISIFITVKFNLSIFPFLDPMSDLW